LPILGPNGSGKTTLPRGLLGRLPLESGEQRIGPSVVVGELGQERQRFCAPGVLLLDAFLSSAPLSNARGARCWPSSASVQATSSGRQPRCRRASGRWQNWLC